jgi:rhodanese-related sulfurtransferase
VMCNEGYQSSLVAATLQRFGLGQATDLIGGFRAWRDEGLAVESAAGREPAGDSPPVTGS